MQETGASPNMCPKQNAVQWEGDRKASTNTGHPAEPSHVNIEAVGVPHVDFGRLKVQQTARSRCTYRPHPSGGQMSGTADGCRLFVDGGSVSPALR